jgi:hypothetical protein
MPPCSSCPTNWRTKRRRRDPLYTAADYEKYIHAKGVHRIGRIYEIVEALDSAHGFDPEVTPSNQPEVK